MTTNQLNRINNITTLLIQIKQIKLYLKIDPKDKEYKYTLKDNLEQLLQFIQNPQKIYLY